MKIEKNNYDSFRSIYQIRTFKDLLKQEANPFKYAMALGIILLVLNYYKYAITTEIVLIVVIILFCAYLVSFMIKTNYIFNSLIYWNHEQDSFYLAYFDEIKSLNNKIKTQQELIADLIKHNNTKNIPMNDIISLAENVIRLENEIDSIKIALEDIEYHNIQTKEQEKVRLPKIILDEKQNASENKELQQEKLDCINTFAPEKILSYKSYGCWIPPYVVNVDIFFDKKIILEFDSKKITKYLDNNQFEKISNLLSVEALLDEKSYSDADIMDGGGSEIVFRCNNKVNCVINRNSPSFSFSEDYERLIDYLSELLNDNDPGPDYETPPTMRGYAI